MAVWLSNFNGHNTKCIWHYGSIPLKFYSDFKNKSQGEGEEGQTYSWNDELGAGTTASVTAQWTVATAASVAVLPEVHLLTFSIHGTATAHLSIDKKNNKLNLFIEIFI